MRRAALLASDLLPWPKTKATFFTSTLSMFNASPSRSLVRRFLTLWVSLAATTAALLAQTPSANDGFDPNVDGNVYTIVVQPDGRILVGGQFTSVKPNGAALATARSNLARFNPDGSLDDSFNPGPNNAVRAIVLQPDGSILIGGDFTSFTPGGTTTPVARKLVARLTSAGAIDPTLNVSFDGSLLPQVYALALQADGRIVVGGNFATVQPAGAAAVNRRNLARISSTGVVDASWDPNPNGIVLALAVHQGGKIIVGGGFTTLNDGQPTASIRNRIARLNVDGTVDSQFNPNADNGVAAIAVQPDGKVLIGGYFNTLQSIDWTVPIARAHFARLEADGRIDAGFESNAAGSVTAIAVAQDGGIVIGGTFTSVWSKGENTIQRSFVARFTPDGFVDATFNGGANAQVAALAVQADGKVLVGGYFTRMFPVSASVDSISRNHLGRIYPNGTLDTTFQLTAGGRPLVSVTQADGKLIVGGSFTNLGGATHNNLARLNADGTVDASYAPDINGRVLTMVLQPDGKLLIGGQFTTVNTVARNHVARLNADGSLDTAFDPNVDNTVGIITLLSDNRILLGGQFTSVQPAGDTSATIRVHLVRLTADGKVDTAAFDPAPDNAVNSIIVLSDGKMIVGGQFSGFSPNSALVATPRGYIAKLNTDGTVDASFSPHLNGAVSAMVQQSDGKIVVGGIFTQVLPTGATTPVDRNHLLRLNADGTLDTTFDPNANNNVLALALQSDGKILAGGTFTTLTPNGRAVSDWILRKYFARLNADGTVDTTLDLDISELLGNRVDSIRVLAGNAFLLGGNFTSLQPTGTVRVARANFARITSSGTVDSTFNVSAGGSVNATINALALQADGKIVAVGQFSDVGAAKTTNIARFTPEGVADFSFGTNLTTDAPINTVAVRPNASNASPQLGSFAWLEANGNLRTSFAPNTSDAHLSGQIRATAFQANGDLLLGGLFTNLSNVSAGNLLRFKAGTGTLDPTFNPAINGQVSAIALQSDGKILIVGNFTTVNTTARNHIARLNPDGSLDSAYDPNANASVRSVVVQPDGKAIVAGDVTTFQPNGATTTTARNYIARLNTDGTLDTAFNPFPVAAVNAVALQSDGKVLIGGAFTSVAPGASTTSTTRNYLARINADGTLDTTFDPNMNNVVNAIALAPNGDIVVGGLFTSLEPTVNGTKITGFPAANIARMKSDGTVDRTFNPTTDFAVNSIAIQPNGQILLAGDFTTLRPNLSGNPIARNHLARLNADGTLDLAFNPDIVGSVFTVAAPSDGSILVGGDFTGLQGTGLLLIGGAFSNVGGVAVPYLALLNDDGSVNSNFLPAPDGAVNAVLTLPDGRFVVGGAFTRIGGAARNRIARFNADGTLDTTYTPPASILLEVKALALQPDGRLLAATGNRVVRLNADGSADTAFGPFVDGPVNGLAVQPDGRIVIISSNTTSLIGTVNRLNPDGGFDTTFNKQTASQPFRAVVLQTNGQIIVSSGATDSAQRRLMRLNGDGTIDAAYNPAPNAAVTALALQRDGRLMIGGSFTTVSGVSRVALARLSPTESSVNTLGVSADRTTVAWILGNVSSELAAVTFEISGDGTNWSLLGNGRRATGSFILTGQSFPSVGNFFIRARGLVPTSGNSTGLYEVKRVFNYASPTFGLPPPSSGTVAGSASSNPSGLAPDALTGVFSGNLPAYVSLAGATTPPTGSSSQPPPTGFGDARLADISTRGRVSADAPIILGFAVSGTSSQTMLLRAVGPSLARFGVDGVAARPLLRLFDANGNQLLENGGWTTSAGVADATARTGAFAFDAGSTDDAAAVVTLAPGSYSMHVLTRDGNAGVALAEIYDASTADQAANARLINLSSRGFAGIGGEALIGGFVITGTANKTVLVRGLGPVLARYGVMGTLADPVVNVYNAQNQLVATNDNWSSLSVDGAISANTAALMTATTQAGAFSLDLGSNDAALSVTLAPGAYTVQVRGADNGSGAAMIELYSRQ